MRVKLGRDGLGGDIGRQRKCLGPHWKMHRGIDDEGTGTGVGQWKARIESLDGGQTAGPEGRPGGQMAQGGGRCIRVVTAECL